MLAILAMVASGYRPSTGSVPPKVIFLMMSIDFPYVDFRRPAANRESEEPQTRRVRRVAGQPWRIGKRGLHDELRNADPMAWRPHCVALNARRLVTPHPPPGGSHAPLASSSLAPSFLARLRRHCGHRPSRHRHGPGAGRANHHPLWRLGLAGPLSGLSGAEKRRAPGGVDRSAMAI